MCAYHVKGVVTNRTKSDRATHLPGVRDCTLAAVVWMCTSIAGDLAAISSSRILMIPSHSRIFRGGEKGMNGGEGEGGTGRGGRGREWKGKGGRDRGRKGGIGEGREG